MKFDELRAASRPPETPIDRKPLVRETIPAPASLQVSFGHATETGQRARNEDCFGIVTPDGDQLKTKGMAFAIADGVSGNGGGREAAEYTVRGILSDYYATPDSWDIPHALDKVLSAINRWLLAQSRAHRELEGMASTLSLLILRGSRYWLAHVGDSRIYRWRGDELRQLTTDHVWERADMQHVLKRAVGLDANLIADYSSGGLLPGDVFLLVTDGVWEALGEARLRESLRAHRQPQAAADALVRAALKNGSTDNLTAVSLRIDRLPATAEMDLSALARALPVPGRLRIGARIDDFIVDQRLHENSECMLYKVRHVDSDQTLVLKTLRPQLRDDAERAAALLSEEWLSRQVQSHYFPQVLPSAPGARNFLYYVMSFHPGATLAQLLAHGRHFSIAEATQIGMRIAKGLGTLHRLQVVHRDIKPDNLHLGDDHKLRILDLGVAATIHSNETREMAGTPSFMAPELFTGGGATPQTDLYAAGVSLYYLLTRKYPYGEIEPFQHPCFGDPTPPMRYRPDIAGWLDRLLLKAVARDPQQRFETAEEFLLALERGERQPVLPPLRTPLAVRKPVALWQGIAAASIAINVLLLYLAVIS